MSIDVDRRRVVQALTFWLRPRFVLRVVNRFQRIAGFAVFALISALFCVMVVATASAVAGREVHAVQHAATTPSIALQPRKEPGRRGHSGRDAGGADFLVPPRG